MLGGEKTDGRTKKGSSSEVSGSRAVVLYGLAAVVVVMAVEVFFSVHRGGYFPQQWSLGAAAIAIALIGAAAVPGYLSFSTVGRPQWAVAGALLVFMAIVAASISWSTFRPISFFETGRTAMYVGTFVLLLPAAARWNWLIVDSVIFGGMMPPAVYGILQKVDPGTFEYNGPGELVSDARVSSTVGYFNAVGLVCAMGALLAISRSGSFRSLAGVPLRALYSAAVVVFFVAMYFSFSRGAILALLAGAMVLFVLGKRRFEILGNAAIPTLGALWIVYRVQEFPALVSRPASLEAIQAVGPALIEPLWQGVLAAAIAQVVFALLVRAVEEYVPGSVRRVARIVGTLAVAGAAVVVLGLGVTAFQRMGGVEELRSQISASYADDAKEAQAEGTTSDNATTRLTSLSGGNRIVLWQIAWENFKEHPLTGTGADTFQKVYETESVELEDPQDVLQPHNMWLSQLSDTGIFSFLAFVTFCVGCLVLAFRNAFSVTRSTKSRALISGSAAAFVAYLVSFTIDWNWHIPAATIPFFALAAVAAGAVPTNKLRVKRVAGSDSGEDESV